MILITGAGGFIANRLAMHLYNKGYKDLVLIDDFTDEMKRQRADAVHQLPRVDRNGVFEWIPTMASRIQFVFHLGARTDTAEKSEELLAHLNTRYSQRMWNICVEYGLPLIYASSAATYGDGSLGYADHMAHPENLKPLNPYGWSKQHFDIWALQQERAPRFWAGLKFFNVYGPGESHKGRMASVIFHAHRQMKESGQITLFKSHKEGIADGEQKRDFVYVEDVCEMMCWMMENEPPSGIYNAGSGKARTFLDLAKAVCQCMHQPLNIHFIDTPEDIRPFYQYFTEADMSSIKSTGFPYPSTSLEMGVQEYIKYLSTQ